MMHSATRRQTVPALVVTMDLEEQCLYAPWVNIGCLPLFTSLLTQRPHVNKYSRS